MKSSQPKKAVPTKKGPPAGSPSTTTVAKKKIPTKTTAVMVVPKKKKSPNAHQHVYESKDHSSSEWRTYAVFYLCFCSMVVEIVCGYLFGSIALVADGIHMGTHCTAFFITAYAYSFSRKHKDDSYYVFGTGKVADLASFTSAIILIFVAFVIIYDSIDRLINPGKIQFEQAFPVAFVGIFVNITSGLILTCGKKGEHGADDGHSHDHGHSHGHKVEHYEYSVADDVEFVPIGDHSHGPFHAPQCDDHAHSGVDHDHGGHDHHDVGHDHHDHGGHDHDHHDSHDHGGHDHHDSHDDRGHDHHGHSSPESQMEHGCVDPHIEIDKDAKFHKDNNFTAAVCHVVADAFVSLLVIFSLLIIHYHPEANCLDPIVAIIGSFVILSWSITLIQDCSLNLLDTNPDAKMTEALRSHLEKDGTTVVNDLHIWRLGPGHLGAIVSVDTTVPDRKREYYLRRLKGFKALSHITIDIHNTFPPLKHA